MGHITVASEAVGKAIGAIWRIPILRPLGSDDNLKQGRARGEAQRRVLEAEIARLDGELYDVYSQLVRGASSPRSYAIASETRKLQSLIALSRDLKKQLHDNRAELSRIKRDGAPRSRPVQSDWLRTLPSAGKQIVHISPAASSIGTTSRQGASPRTLGTSRDIIDSNDAKEALRDTEEQLRQSQKIEAISSLAGGVAHDINNMLHIILGYCDLTLEDAREEGNVVRDIQEIKNAAKRASSLTRQLLAFSRKTIVKPSVVDLNVLVSDMSRMLDRVLGEDIELVFIPTPSLNGIEIDVGQIEQILLNLVINARDAMPKGGTITIETANTTIDETFVSNHNDLNPGSYVVLCVTDTGEGMNQETRSRIFEPFFTTKGKDRGTGLGLSTVLQIVKQCGGDIHVSSEPDKGSSFKFYFPTAVKEVVTRSK